MGDLFDFEDDGQVSEEEEEEALLLFMDDEDEDEDSGTQRGGCLTAILIAAGITAAVATLPFLL